MPITTLDYPGLLHYALCTRDCDATRFDSTRLLSITADPERFAIYPGWDKGGLQDTGAGTGRVHGLLRPWAVGQSGIDSSQDRCGPVRPMRDAPTECQAGPAGGRMRLRVRVKVRVRREARGARGAEQGLFFTPPPRYYH